MPPALSALRPPHCEPAPNPIFVSLLRLHRGQAEGDKVYQFTELGDAAQFFAGAAEEQLQACATTELLAPFLGEPLAPVSFKYKQLQRVDADIPNVAGKYTTTKVGEELYVSNPVGETFSITTMAKRPFTLRLVCTLGPQVDLTPAVAFSYEKVSAATETAGFKVNERVCRVGVGQLFCGDFSESEWQHVKPVEKLFKEKLFLVGAPVANQEEEAEEESVESGVDLENVEGCLSKKKGKKWVRLCNFEITRIVRILTVEESDEVYVIVECRMKWSDEELPMLELAHDVKDTDVENGHDCKTHFSGVIKEVVLPQSITSDARFRQLFTEHFPHFQAWGVNLKQMSMWIDVLSRRDDCGPRQHTISYYGRQKSGWHVMSNCAFRNGEVRPHEEVGVCVMTSVFKNGKQALLPVECHPSMFLVPDDHVRFIFTLQFWNEMLPRHFTNNVIPVKAAICTAIMHLQGDKFWGGQGPAPGLPMAWLYSSEGSTGKSRCQKLINALCGWEKAPLLMGANTSEPALFMSLSQQSCLSLQVDEITTKEHVKEKNNSTMIKDAVHACFDQSRKACLQTKESSGAIKPLTSLIVSSNVLPNATDAPLLQRILFLRFMKGEPPADFDGSSIQEEFPKMLKVVSCILPDVESFLVDGELDRDGLSDCTAFTNKLLDTHAQRHANMWGYLLYYMLLMWRSTCTSLEDFKLQELNETFKFVCEGVGAAHQDAESSASTFDLFLRACELVRTSLSANPLVAADRCLHHHNFRTTAKPPGYGTLSNMQYISIRLDSACHVIEKVMGEHFSTKEIKMAINEREGCDFKRGYFYDIAKNPWPIVTTNVDEVTGCVSQVALPEEELQDGTMSRYYCLWIEKAVYDRVVCQETELELPLYATIEITSHGRTFNFFEGVQQDSWIGYAALHGCFGMFNGIKNALLVPSKPSELTPAHGCDPAYFDLDTYLANYSHSWDQETPPRPLQYNPFQYRNQPGDVIPSDEMDEGDDFPADTLESGGSTPSGTPLAGKSRRSPELGGDMTEAKRPRCQFVNDEVEELDINSDDENEARWHTLLYPTNYSPPIPA